jgi:hypothetical protein
MGVPQGSVLGPLLCTADLPTSPGSITATFADDTAVVATDSDPATASQKLQITLLAIQSWLQTWRIKANKTKSAHVMFTIRCETCPPVHINDVELPHENHVKNLGLHLDRRLTWHTHILQNVNNLESPSPRCTGYSGTSPNSLPATNSSSTKQYSNPSGHMAFNSGIRPQIPTSKFWSVFNPKSCD